MPGGIGGMDYCSPCKAKTGPLFMICHATGEESYPSSRIERKVSCKLLLGTRENR